MAKKFYGIDMQGNLLIRRISSHPTPTQSEIYNYTPDGHLWACGDGSNNYRLVHEGTDIEYDINITGSATSGKYS